jgi:hypothetical protein
MKAFLLVFLTGVFTPVAFGGVSTIKTEVVEEQPHTESKTFCAKGNADEASKLCETWLNRQLKTLGEKVLTSNCSTGDMTTDSGCLFRSQGEVTWVMKKYRSETERH